MMEGRSGSRVLESTPEKVARERAPGTGTHDSRQGTKEARMATKAMAEHRSGPSERGGDGVSAGRPMLAHHVVARQGNKGLEVLRVPLQGKGETLPVFTAAWAAHAYLFAGEASGRGWYARTCSPGELASLLVGLCAGVEWVALDPRPGDEGEAANVMPRENFVDYLLHSSAPFLLRRRDFETIGGAPHGR